jgi:hypothetical protein
VSARFPLRYVRANVLLGPGGERAAVYRLGMVAYPFLPAGEKWRWLRTLERFAALVGTDFSICRVNRAYPAERYVHDTSVLLDERTVDPEAFRAFLEGQRRRLAQLASHTAEVYVVVSLHDTSTDGFGSGLLRSVDRARRRLEDLAGVAAAQPISGRELDGIAVVEQQTFEQIRGVLACERARTKEIEWLLRRVEVRGLGEPDLDRYWDPDALVVETGEGEVAYQPLEHDLWRCLNAPVIEPRSGAPRLLVESERGCSHQALLSLGALADAPAFPGPMTELLFAPLEAVPFPVDAVLHARWIGNRQALAQVRKRITDVEHVYREQFDGDARGPGLLAEEDRVLAREYEAILQSSGHPPMLYGSIGLAVGAADDEELEQRVTALRDQFGELTLHRPRGLQEALYLDHLPRPGGGAVRDYTQQVTVEQFGALMPLGTQRIGSERGVYLGVSGGAGGRPVKYDVTEAAREDRPSTVLLCGTLGSGKSAAAQTIAYGAALRGSQIIDFDPKPDHGLDRIAQLAGRVRVLELSGAAEHRGALDPLAIGLDDDMREELASSYYLDLLRNPPPAWEVAIQRAVRDAVRRGERNSLAVINRLRKAQEPAAREAGTALEVIADFGLARLGFGDGSSHAATSTATPVTTIRTPGLTLPDPRASRETYTRAERISVATLSLVAALAMRLVSHDRTRHKVVLLDEAWFLLASTQGRALIHRLVLLGRAFNATVLLATQLLGHVGDLSDLIGTYLIFGQESDAEAKRALAQIALDPNDGGLVARLRGYRRGRCLMRDLDGRVGELQVDLVFRYLRDALNTTPRTA